MIEEPVQKPTAGVDIAFGVVVVLTTIVPIGLFILDWIIGPHLSIILWPFLAVIPGMSILIAVRILGLFADKLGIFGVVVMVIGGIAGSILAGMGLVLCYQNITDHWEMWAYGWALLIVFTGIGMMLGGLWSAAPTIVFRIGKRAAIAGTAIFLLLGMLFELLLNVSDRPYYGVVWAVALIGLGGYFVWSSLARRAPVADEEVPPTTEEK